MLTLCDWKLSAIKQAEACSVLAWSLQLAKGVVLQFINQHVAHLLSYFLTQSHSKVSAQAAPPSRYRIMVSLAMQPELNYYLNPIKLSQESLQPNASCPACWLADRVLKQQIHCCWLADTTFTVWSLPTYPEVVLEMVRHSTLFANTASNSSQVKIYEYRN